MTDDRLSAFVPDIMHFEGVVPWLYRDTLGYATVGVGNLVRDALDAASLPFAVDGGRAASAQEIGQEFLRVIAMSRGLPAAHYRKDAPPRVELAPGTSEKLCLDRLRGEFLPGILRLLPGFDSFPAGPQSAIVDIAFNCGVHGLAGFSHMLAACKAGDWKAAGAACHRSTSRPDRNDWARDKFLSAVS